MNMSSAVREKLSPARGDGALRRAGGWLVAGALALALGASAWLSGEAEAQPRYRPVAPAAAPDKPAATPSAPAAPGAISPATKEAIVKRAAQLVKDRAYATGVDFESKWEEALVKHKDALDRAVTERDFANAMNRVFREFGVSHINLSTPQAADQRNSTSFVGIGIRHSTLGRITPGEGLTIGEVIDGSGAAEAGLLAGDTITKVGGVELEDPGVFRGEEGTKVKVTVRRGPEHPTPGKEEEIELTRKRISTVEPIVLKKVGEDAGVLRLPTFSTGYSRGKVEELFREARGLKYLVLDLRGNGGGAVVNLTHFLGMLLPAGTEFGTQISRRTADRFRDEEGKEPDDPAEVAKWSQRKMRVSRNSLRDESGEAVVFSGKLAVLIDRGSASASEITAAALSELRGALLVGSRTAGAVLVSTPVRVDGGFQVTVPISDYVTIKGRRLEDHPLVADAQLDSRGRGSRARGTAADLATDRWVTTAIEKLREAEAASQPAPSGEKKD